MKVGILTNIFLSGINISSYLKRKGLQVNLMSVSLLSKENLQNFVKNNDIIVIDVYPSVLKETIAKIKDIDLNKPLLVLGDSQSYKDIIDISRMGIYKYLKKPIDPQVLLRYINEYQSREEINKRNAKKGFAIYTRVVNGITTVSILGYLQEEIIDNLKEIVSKSSKVIISLNGISSMSLDTDVLKRLKELLNSGSEVKFVLVREKIKNILVEEGIQESLIFPNEFSAVRSFQSGGNL